MRVLLTRSLLGGQMGCIRGFKALVTNDNREMARQIKESMRKDSKPVGVLAEETSLVQGKNVKEPFGWFFKPLTTSILGKT
jgi:hypothetical protein